MIRDRNGKVAIGFEAVPGDAGSRVVLSSDYPRMISITEHRI
jgi:hypothetical protein